jgi:exodeoxyribonuclease VII large subunit
VLSRARLLASCSRAPAAHRGRQRARLHQQLREIRAGSRRRIESERQVTERRAVVIERKTASFLLDCRERRPRELAQLALALAGHDPQRTLERGYVLARSAEGNPIVTAEGARDAGELRLRFADGSLPARVLER